MTELTAALVAKPAAAAPRQASKRASAQRKPAQDPQELEADRLAGKAAGGGRSPATPPASPASPGGETPPAHALEVLREPGRALDTAVRCQMGSRLGHDFGRVRIHTGIEAAASTSRLQARAYTIGSHVVFNSGHYHPQSREGRELLAHELAHVVQQSARPDAAPSIQFKKAEQKEPQGKFYQEVIDNIEYEKKEYARRQKESGLGFHNINYDSLKLLLALCEAVDQNRKDEVPARLDALLKEGLKSPFQTLSEALLTELGARLFEMGLESDAERLRKAYHEEQKMLLAGDLTVSRRNVQFYTRLVDGAIATASAATPESLDQSVRKFVRAFVPLRDAYAAIDWKALDWERQSRSGWMVMRPGMSHEEWYEALRGLIGRWVGGLSALTQQALEAARADFENNGGTGAGTTLLEHLRQRYEGELRSVFYPSDQGKNINLFTFDITQTRLGKGKGSISDLFAKGREAARRSVPVTTYDPAQEYTQELKTTLDGFYRIRIEQIHVIGRVYGALSLLTPNKDFAQGMQTAEEASDNAASLKKLAGGRLRLDSDDDWRNFLLQKYRDMTSPTAPPAGSQQPKPRTYTPAEALHTVVNLLFAYLQAFTVHARFTNIYDVGETSYLNRPFPHALTGQLVHDCGVYALRVAYMLSLVRKELGLRFRFVVLPVHISLIITGDNLPAYIIENDSFSEVSPDRLANLRRAWEGYTDPDSKARPAGKTDDEQFIGELAAVNFISGPIDMPFSVVDVPKPLDDAKAEQRQLWAYYQRTSPKEIFGPASKDKNDPDYLFHKRYLGLTEALRQIHNEAILPFWNDKAPAIWNRFQKAMSANDTRTRIAVNDLMPLLGNYKNEFNQALKPVEDRFKGYEAEQRSISKRLRDNPKLARTGVRLSYGLRAAQMWVYRWITHRRAIEAYEKQLISRPTGAQEALPDVTTALEPFYVPVPDKSLQRLD